MTLVNDVQPRSHSAPTLLAKVWQQIPKVSTPTTWFLTHSYVGLVEGKSLVTVHNVHPEIDGTHLVDIFVGQGFEQPCKGVLFCVRGLSVASRGCEVKSPSTRVIWQYDLGQIGATGVPPAFIDERFLVRSDSTLYHIKLAQYSGSLQNSELLQELRLMHASEGVHKQLQSGASDSVSMGSAHGAVASCPGHGSPLFTRAVGS